ncbi:RNA polymerase sigma factor, partial [Micromonospora arida]
MESTLRARVRAGDPGAFADLFDTYARSVYNHAFRLTADWATAEDVLAATYLQAWRSRERVTQEGGSLRPWLLGIADARSVPWQSTFAVPGRCGPRPPPCGPLPPWPPAAAAVA